METRRGKRRRRKRESRKAKTPPKEGGRIKDEREGGREGGKGGGGRGGETHMQKPRCSCNKKKQREERYDPSFP
jgi:hypothetical protein